MGGFAFCGRRRRNFGRVMLCIVSLCFAVQTFDCGDQTGRQEKLQMDDGLLEQVSDVCSDGTYFYLAAGHRILKYSGDGELVDEFYYKDRRISEVAYGNSLYALDEEHMELLRIGEDGKALETMEVQPQLGDITQISARDKVLYLNCAGQDTVDGRSEIYRLDTKRKRWEQARKSDVPQELSGRPKAAAVCCDQKEQDMFYVEGNVVYRYQDGTSVALHHLSMTPDKMAAAGDYLLLLETHGELVLVTKAAES